MDQSLNRDGKRDGKAGWGFPLQQMIHKRLGVRTLVRRFLHSDHWLHLLLVAWLGVLSFLPMLQSYVWAIDDYPLSQMARSGWSEYLATAFEERGAWRLLQHGLVGLILNSGDVLPGLLAVLCHVLTCQFFYLVFSGLSERRDDALNLALVAACSPLGFQSITWTSALPYVLSSLILWVSLWMFMRFSSIPKEIWMVWATVFTASLLVHDHLIFALSFVAGAAWLMAPQPSRFSSWFKPSIQWVPMLAVCLYLYAYIIFKPQDHPLYMEPHFHWPSLLGPSARIWQWLDIWEAMLHPTLWQVAASEWPLGWWGLVLSILGGLGALWMIPRNPNGIIELGKTHAIRVALAIAILFLMASLIYVPAGGYSLDSRKRYPFVLFVLGGAGAIALPWLRNLFPCSPKWIKRAVMIPMATVLMSACWFHVGLWRSEARATRLLSDFLALHPALRRVYAEKLVDPMELSSITRRLHGQPWIAAAYVELPFAKDYPEQIMAEIGESPDEHTHTLIYDYSSRSWSESKVSQK